MDALALNLISGLIGALIGAGISIYLYRKNQQDTSRQRLLAMLFRLGFRGWYYPDNKKHLGLLLRQSHHAAWPLYIRLRQTLWWMPWKRKKLDKAWQRFARITYYDEIPDEEFWKLFTVGFHGTREEGVKACAEFIRFLEKL